jgi:PAS domain S-box-containing protein
VSLEFGSLLQWARQAVAKPNAVWRYGIAVAAAMGVRLAFGPLVAMYAPYLPFTLALTVAALFGGRGPGLAAVALSTLAVDWLFLEPRQSLALANPALIWTLGLFVVSGLLIALLVGSLRESLLARAGAEEALRRQAQLIDLSHDAVITMDSRRRIITWNKGAEEIYGWAERDAVGKVFPQLLHTVGDVPMAEVDEILRRDRHWEGELRPTTRDGRRLVVDSRQVLLADGFGLPTCILAISRDITARKKMEEDLRQNEDQFRTLANAIPHACGMANRDGRFFWVNQRLREYTGLTLEQAKDWGWTSALDRESSSTALERWRKSIATGEPFESVFSVRGADGAVRPFLALAMPLRDRDGKVVRWFGTMTDISAQRKGEEALRKAHGEQVARAAELQAIMDAMPAAVFISRDRECRHAFGNQNSYQLLHEPPGSNLSKSAPEGEGPTAFRVIKAGKEIPPHECPLQRAAATGQAIYAQELELALQDGSRANIIGNAVPLLDAEGRPNGAVAIFVDITEQKKTEERLRQAQKLESIGLLAGGVAHDFNNLLTVIMGSAYSVLSKYPPTEEVRNIITASERAANLTRQLLAYAGKGQFVSETFDITKFVSRCTELLTASVPKKVGLTFHLSPEELPVKADPSQIEQVLMNLVINAGEAIPPHTEGRIAIVTSACQVTLEVVRAHAPAFDARPGPFVCLDVSDNGSGMDEATVAHIFDPFFSTKFTGRGLGLAAVHGIVRSCNGFIEVSSAFGAGSKFRVFLPAAGNKPLAQVSVASLPDASRRRKPAPATVLVVDDEEMVREMACAVLREGGCQVLEAGDGRHALEVLAGAASPPSLALLDLAMPRMGAEELVPILNRKFPGLRIVVTSGYLEADARRRFSPRAVAGFLQKPFRAGELLEKVEQALHDPSAARKSASTG